MCYKPIHQLLGEHRATARENYRLLLQRLSDKGQNVVFTVDSPDFINIVFNG